MLRNITRAKEEKVTELWLWELYGKEDRAISDSQMMLKKHIHDTMEGEMTYSSVTRGVIFVFCKDHEIGVIKKVPVV
jgi:hypothetical protein